MSSNINFNPSEPNSAITSGQSSSSAPVTSSSITDSLSSLQALSNPASVMLSANYPTLPTPDNISIVEFYKLVGTATLQNQKAIQEAFGQQARILNALFIYMNQLGLGIPGVTDALEGTYNQQKELYEQAQGLAIQANGYINQYNSSISEINGAITNLNNAIQAHNNGQMSDLEFSQAVNDYNAFIAQKNQSIQDLRNQINQVNGQIDNLNQQLQNVNTQLQQYGIQPVPLLFLSELVPNLETATPQTVNQLTPLVSLPLINPDPLLNPDGWYNTIQEVLGPNLSRASEVFAFNSAWMNIINNFQEQQFYYLPGKNIILPNAYTTENVATNSSGRTSTGQAFTDTAAISQLSELNKMAGNTLVKNILKKYDMYFNPQAFADLKQLVLGTLMLSGLIGPSSALIIYADRLAQQQEDSKAFLSASAIGVAKGILTMVAQNALKPAITNILASQYGNAGKEAAEEVNAALNSSLLFSSASMLSNALNLPGLTAQLMANVKGVDLDDLQVAAAPKNTAASSLGNPISVTLARESLVNSLGAAQSADGERIASALDKAIGQIGPYSTASTIRATLQKEFTNQGFTETNSLAMANSYMAFLKSENNSEIETALNAGSVDNTALISGLSSSLMGRGFNAAAAASISQSAVLDALQGPFESARGLKNNLSASLAEQGIAPSLAATLASAGASIALGQPASYAGNLNENALATSLKALNPQISAENIAAQIGKKSYPDEDLLRVDLQAKLKDAGLSDQDALNIAQQATVTNVGGSLNSLGLGNRLSPEQIAQEIHNNLTQSTSPSMSPTIAKKLAQEVTHTLLGSRPQQDSVDRRNPHSFTALMEDQLDVLKGHGNAFAQASENYYNRSRNLNAFLNAVQDPGQRLVITQVGAINEITSHRINNSSSPIEPTIGVQG